MVSRSRFARALPKDFANEFAEAKEQVRQGRYRELAGIPALQQLSWCGQAAALHRWERSCARLPARSLRCCLAIVALTIADQFQRRLSRLTDKPVLNPTTSSAR